MGLPGLLTARLGAARVRLSDYEPRVLRVLQQNAELNGVGARCTCHRLDWGDRGSMPPDWRGACRMVLGADLLYATATVTPLLATLRELLHPREGEHGAGAKVTN